MIANDLAPPVGRPAPPPTHAPSTPVPEWSDRAFAPAAQAQLERLLQDLKRVYQERKAAMAEVDRAHHEALFRLALAADYRDGDTGAHIVRIGFLAEALARAAGMPPESAAMLRRAAPMHDVGKVGIPDAVLKKAGPLDDAEREVMNRHPELGARILASSHIPMFQLAAEVALTHHERWDGAGYPNGLAGSEIPLSGRIVAIVDCFDALTMDRCYRPAYSEEHACQMLRAERGRAFDPRLVDLFLERREEMAALRRRLDAAPPTFGDLIAASACPPGAHDSGYAA